MNTTITLENLINPFFLPRELDYSSDSLVESIDKAEEQAVNDKFLILKNNIGEELFNQLSYDDKNFMIKTASSIDFGHPVDLNKITRDIKNYDYY